MDSIRLMEIYIYDKKKIQNCCKNSTKLKTMRLDRYAHNEVRWMLSLQKGQDKGGKVTRKHSSKCNLLKLARCLLTIKSAYTPSDQLELAQ